MERLTASELNTMIAKSDSVLKFEKKVYSFNKKDSERCVYNFSNTTVIPERNIGFLVKERRNLVIDGNGAEFVFTGHMTPIAIDSCENITIKNMVIDFEPPLVAEGEVVGRGDNVATVKINKELFPYQVEDGWISFDIGEDDMSPLCRDSQIHFDCNGAVSTGSGDDFVPYRVEDCGEFVKLYAENCPVSRAPFVGDRFVLRHNERLHPGIFIENSRNITIENVWIKSCGGLGVLAQFSENLTLRRVDFVPDEKKGRRVSCGRDDGLHATSMKGTVTVENCSFRGLMDDPINVHGCSMKVTGFGEDLNTIRAKYMHPQAKNFKYFAKKGDVISVMNQDTLAPVISVTVQSFERDSEDTIIIKTVENIKLPDGKYAIENVTNTPSFVCRNNRFGSCRARGILVTTRKKVLIEDNIFESSGSAILMSGDANYWYESGECQDVTIRRNVFTDKALSSEYQFTKGVISICPIVLEPSLEKPFHKNIVISDNMFYTPDTTVLYAYASTGIMFSNNRIFKSESRKPITDGALVKLEWCSDVTVKDNILTGQFNVAATEEENCKNIKKDM